jgi:hypothetical protein
MELAPHDLASRHDIRLLVIRTLLTYLELAGYLEAGTPIYAEYELRPDRPLVPTTAARPPTSPPTLDSTSPTPAATAPGAKTATTPRSSTRRNPSTPMRSVSTERPPCAGKSRNWLTREPSPASSLASLLPA